MITSKENIPLSLLDDASQRIKNKKEEGEDKRDKRQETPIA